MAARRLAIELKPEQLEFLCDLTVAETGQAAHLRGGNNGELLAFAGSRQRRHFFSLPASFK